METNIEKLAFEWIEGVNADECLRAEFYCGTRDVFAARLDKMTRELLSFEAVDESPAYILSAIAGEIGNNSFDHNIGNWPDIPGVFFGYALNDLSVTIVLADRGNGVFRTLIRVKPEMTDDLQALKAAFFERITGRAPELRGNGLKFVRENVQAAHFVLSFYSGGAKIKINNQIEITKNAENISGCLAIITFRQTNEN